MNLIKINAIDSTNTFLKQMVDSVTLLENFTVVWTLCQTRGRGQRGTQWKSENGKNLTFSVLIRISKQFSLPIHSMNIACGVVQALKEFGCVDVKIKWPNDILWKNKKIGGILIENRISSNEVVSVVGIGVNVLQENFEHLPQASSLKVLGAKNLDIESLLRKIVDILKDRYTYICTDQNRQNIYNEYHEYLFGRNVFYDFQNFETGEIFRACTEFVDMNGEIHLKDPWGKYQSFSLKQIKMLY